MEEQYIDIRNSQQQYERLLASFEADDNISRHNRELVLRFLRDATLGKTVVNKAKKKIGPSRLIGYIHHLYPLIGFLNKNLDQVTQDDMESFIEALEAGRILARPGAARNTQPRAISARYRVEIKFTVRKFYKWLWGDNKVYPPIVEWIDTYFQPKEIPALTESEIQRLLDHCGKVIQRAIIQVLFDGGFRIGELLNIRLRHVRLMQYDPSDPRKKCFVLRVPFSKTLRRTVPLPMETSTRLLRQWLEQHPAKPTITEEGTVEALDADQQLFPLTDNAIRLMLHRLGRAALRKRVYPHLLRHTSATYWSNKLPYFRLCKRFGWSMTSKMPQRYIDREGVDDLAVVSLYNEMNNRSVRDKMAREAAVF